MNATASWGFKPPPRDLETAPAAIQARVRYAQTVFVVASGVGTFAGGLLLGLLSADAGQPKYVLICLMVAMLASGPFFVGRAFFLATGASLERALGVRFAVQSVEAIVNPSISSGTLTHLVALKGLDQPALEAGALVAELPADFDETNEVVGLPTERGEFLILGIGEREVFPARPSAKIPDGFALAEKR